MYVVFNNGHKFIASNLYHMVEAFYAEKMYLDDYQAELDIEGQKDFFLASERTFSSTALTAQLENRFEIYRCYFIVRKCPECKFVFGAGSHSKINNEMQFYQLTCKKFETLCAEFFICYSDVIKSVMPDYDRALILNDMDYAKKIITNKIRLSQSLSKREAECLFWAAKGKSAEETAIILSIKPCTIEFHRRNIIKKLHCVNISQAIYEALKHGQIGLLQPIPIATNNLSNGLSVENSHFTNIDLINQQHRTHRQC